MWEDGEVESEAFAQELRRYLLQRDAVVVTREYLAEVHREAEAGRNREQFFRDALREELAPIFARPAQE